MKAYHLVLFILIILVTGCTSCTDNENKAESEKNTPESQGISSGAILGFINAAEKEQPNEIHSFVLLIHGKEVASGWWKPYDQESPHTLYSLSKSFTSTAIGIAQAEGLLSINDQVISFFPEETPDSISTNLGSMRIRDLLKMNSGHNQEPDNNTFPIKDSWVKGFLFTKVEHKPGTHFVYNSMATFMLSAIIQKVSGQTLEEYLTPRIFEPLDITTHRWELNKDSINYGGWGLNIRTRDIANLGQLYLQKGNWKGKQLVPEEWVKEATSYQTSNGSNPTSDWEQGYGYQFWMCRHGLYRGDGAFGQFCFVMPEHDAVLAITSGTSDMQAIMNLVWDHLLPAFKKEPLEPDEIAYKALLDKTATLTLKPVEGEANNTPVSEKIVNRTYKLDENDWGMKNISFKLDGDEKSISLSNNDSTYILPIGYKEFKNGYCNFGRVGRQSVATSGAWTVGDTLSLMMYLDETPHGYKIKVAFDGDKLIMKREFNIIFGNTRQKDIVGRAMK